MTVANDIATARAWFEKAEREADPELKAHALEEALVVLAAIDADEASAAERELVANVRRSHARRLLVQVVALSSVSMDAWLDYVRLLFGDLQREVEALIKGDAELAQNYDRFLNLFGPRAAEILQQQEER